MLNNIVIGDSDNLLLQIQEAQKSDKQCISIMNRLLKDLETTPKCVHYFVINYMLVCKQTS